MTELRSYLMIDRLQPRTACYLAATARGVPPRGQMAMALIDVSGALDIQWLADITLKSVDVEPSLLQMDSRGGWLALHGHRADEVKAAGELILSELNTHNLGSEGKVKAPKIVNSRIVSRLDPRHAMMINRQRSGDLCLPGESLFMLDCTPASYALLAVNEAEKGAAIKVIDLRITGSMGRMILSGPDAQIRAAADAAATALLRAGA